MSKQKIKSDCKLLPHVREEILSIQEAQQRQAWGISTFRVNEIWEYSTGDGVKIAVIDTGVDLDHPDLVDNLLPGRNILNTNANPRDDNGHGSHVAGIICAKNNELGVVGIAPNCKIVPVKVLDRNGNGNLINVAEGIRWAANQEVDFIVLSLGSPNKMPIVLDAIKFAQTKGVIVCCAAGNAGKTKQIFYPAAYSEVIGIGAIDSNLARAKFSCTGSDLDFLTPGDNILSTVPDNWYAVISGTSMSNPYFVGLCALLLSFKRANNLELSLNSHIDYINFFKNYVIHLQDESMSGKKIYEGYGIIDSRLLINFFRN